MFHTFSLFSIRQSPTEDGEGRGEMNLNVVVIANKSVIIIRKGETALPTVFRQAA